MISDNTDCDDTNASINPDADELCFDGVDNNCDGAFDDETAIDAFSGYLDLRWRWIWWWGLGVEL